MLIGQSLVCLESWTNHRGREDEIKLQVTCVVFPPNRIKMFWSFTSLFSVFLKLNHLSCFMQRTRIIHLKKATMFKAFFLHQDVRNLHVYCRADCLHQGETALIFFCPCSGAAIRRKKGVGRRSGFVWLQRQSMLAPVKLYDSPSLMTKSFLCLTNMCRASVAPSHGLICLYVVQVFSYLVTCGKDLLIVDAKEKDERTTEKQMFLGHNVPARLWIPLTDIWTKTTFLAEEFTGQNKSR